MSECESDYLVRNMRLQEELSTLRAERDALQARIEASETQDPFWFAVVSDKAPVVNKAIRSEEEADSYANVLALYYDGVKILPLYTHPFIQPAGMMLVPVDISNHMQFREEIRRRFGLSFGATKDAWANLLKAAPAKGD